MPRNFDQCQLNSELFTWRFSVCLLVEPIRPEIGKVGSFSGRKMRPRDGRVNCSGVADVDRSQWIDWIGELGVARKRVQNRLSHRRRKQVELPQIKNEIEFFLFL